MKLPYEALASDWASYKKDQLGRVPSLSLLFVCFVFCVLNFPPPSPLYSRVVVLFEVIMTSTGDFGELGLSIIGVGCQYPPYALKTDAIDILGQKFYPDSAAYVSPVVAARCARSL